MQDVTIKDYIQSGRKASLKMPNYFYTGVLVDDSTRLYVLDDSILIPYDNILNQHRITYTMKDEEYRKYKYNPWRVAYDVYGTTELWFLILHANEMYSAMEFNIKTLDMYTDDIFNILDEILTIEDSNMRKNQSEVNKFMKDLPTKLSII